MMAIEQIFQVLRAAQDVLPRVEWIVDVELFGYVGHQLHQPLRAGIRHRKWIEGRLGVNDRANQVRIDAIEVSGFRNGVVVGNCGRHRAIVLRNRNHALRRLVRLRSRETGMVRHRHREHAEHDTPKRAPAALASAPLVHNAIGVPAIVPMAALVVAQSQRLL